MKYFHEAILRFISYVAMPKRWMNRYATIFAAVCNGSAPHSHNGLLASPQDFSWVAIMNWMGLHSGAI